MRIKQVTTGNNTSNNTNNNSQQQQQLMSLTKKPDQEGNKGERGELFVGEHLIDCN